MFVNIPQLGDAMLYGYRYDQLNRIKSMDAFSGFNSAANNYGPGATAIADYKERITYDPNGNIKTYLRNGKTSIALNMDDLGYEYISNTNQLKRVTDNTGYTANYPGDIDHQTNASNYQYDAIGNLISDASEGITDISWNVYGKIQSITKASGTIHYTYDASGNRISKTYDDKTTWYVRDASGNVMSTYIVDAEVNDGRLTQNEIHLYGSSRLGIINLATDVEEPLDMEGLTEFERGRKFFELSNHLGNVLVTVSDKKIGLNADGDETIDNYAADVVTANDYYPFGMIMPGRTFSAGSGYRYGFNGKEKDNEVSGEGNQQDYGMRIYDTRLGKFLSVDPITRDYPELTPYQFASNTPIQARDLDGLEADIVTQTIAVAIWFFGGDVDKISSGSAKINSGIWKAVDGPARSQEYNNYANNPDPDFTFEQQNAIRKADGITEALGGVGEIIDGVSSIGGKIEAVAWAPTLVKGGMSLVNRELQYEGFVSFLQKKGSSEVIEEVERIKKFLDEPIPVTSPKPTVPYNRTQHYGNTPTKADRKALGATSDDVVDHTTPLVQHYYEGDGKGGKPGFLMTPEGRKMFANDRSKMKLQPNSESNSQGGTMSNYSKLQKKKFGF
jgi:RHS repeat-associated protein